MLRKISFIAIIILALAMLVASRPVIGQSSSLNILPLDCRVMAGEYLSMELDGSLPSDAVVIWGANDGGVASVLPSSNAVLLAPSTPGTLTVYVTISSNGSAQETSLTRHCIVTPTDNFSG